MANDNPEMKDYTNEEILSALCVPDEVEFDINGKGLIVYVRPIDADEMMKMGAGLFSSDGLPDADFQWKMIALSVYNKNGERFLSVENAKKIKPLILPKLLRVINNLSGVTTMTVEQTEEMLKDPFVVSYLNTLKPSEEQ